MSAQPTTITPKALAEELGIDPKRLRAYLRREHSRDAEVKGTTWAIPLDTAEAAREHFTPAEEEEEVTEPEA